MNKLKKIAVYDLSVCPVTFDFVHFLSSARLYFVKWSKRTDFDLLIIADDFRKLSPRDKAFDSTTKEWRIHNLLYPILACSPYVKNITILRERPQKISNEDVIIYPPDYKLEKPIGHPYYFGRSNINYYNKSLSPACFQAPIPAIEHAQALFPFRGKPRALIAPRYSNFEGSRNTSLNNTNIIIDSLIDNDFDVGFIHDQEDSGEFYRNIKERNSLFFINDACFNIPIRLALHEIVNLNIFTPTALSAFAVLAKSNPNIVFYDMYKPPNKSFTGNIDDYKNRVGLKINEIYPWPWSPKNQVYIWDKDFNIDKIVTYSKHVAKFARPEKFQIK